MSIDQVISLEPRIKTLADYKRNSAIKRRPPGLDPDYAGKTVIWKDEKNNKIGVSDEFHSQVFSLDEIHSFSIENVLQAKGAAEGHLNIQLHQRAHSLRILSGDCYDFDSIADQLADLSGKPVDFLEEYYNC